MSVSPLFMVIPPALNTITLGALTLRKCGSVLKYRERQSEIQP